MHIQYTQRLLRRPMLSSGLLSSLRTLNILLPSFGSTTLRPQTPTMEAEGEMATVTPVSGTSVNVLPNNITIQHQMFVCHQIGFPVQFEEEIK